MKSIKIDLSKDLNSIEIHTFADLHIGDKHCDLTNIKKRIEYVKNTENAYVILNGDLLNNAIKTSVSDIYSEKLTPMEELNRCVELFEPIKDKILCITTGNHERRTYNGSGIDLMEILSKELRIEERFSNASAVLFVRLGWNKSRKRKQWYSIFVTHGSGGGRKVGAKAVRLADMESIVDCDIYIHSHTHLPMVFKQSFYRSDFINSNVSLVDKLFVNTSAELNYGGYGEVYEFKPSSKECPVIYLSGTSKEFIAKL
jgi:predicted phosphodiesterase